MKKQLSAISTRVIFDVYNNKTSKYFYNNIDTLVFFRINMDDYVYQNLYLISALDL